MSTQLQPVAPRGLSLPGLPAVSWRDPHTVSPAALGQTIRTLEEQCLQNPESADIHTCLGMAYAMNFDVYKSMDVLEKAVAIEPLHFWAQMKYAELLYRLRALPRSQEETSRALDLATSAWEMDVARKQLQEIRRLMRDGTQKPAWTKPLWPPVLVMIAILAVLSVTHIWR
jgi:hypothetical protein